MPHAAEQNRRPSIVRTVREGFQQGVQAAVAAAQPEKKVEFDGQEAAGSMFLKVGDDGVYVIRLLAGNKLSESMEADPSSSWDGQWQVEGNALTFMFQHASVRQVFRTDRRGKNGEFFGEDSRGIHYRLHRLAVRCQA